MTEHRSIFFIEPLLISLLESERQGFLEENQQSSTYHYTSYVRAFLAKVRVLGFSKAHHNSLSDDVIAQFLVFNIILTIFFAEQQSGTAHVSLCDEVYPMLEAVNQRCATLSLTPNWYTLAGVLEMDVADPPIL